MMFVFVSGSYLIGPFSTASEASGMIAELARVDAERDLLLVRRVPESELHRDPENYNQPADTDIGPGRHLVCDIVMEIVG